MTDRYDLEDPDPPPDAGEGSTLRAKDLKNKPLLIRPTAIGTDIGKDGTEYEYVACEVWTLDRMGIEDHSTDVRFTWWRVKPVLREKMGHLIAARPVQQDDNSVILERLTGPAREAAEKAVVEIRPSIDSVGPAEGPVTHFEDEYSDEPF